MRNFARFVLPCLLITSTTQVSLATSAPAYPVPTLNVDNRTTLAPIDILSASVVFEFDVATRKATGRASILFTMLDNGYPMFDLVPNTTSISLDNQVLNAGDMHLQSAPDDPTMFRYLATSLQSGTQHTASFTYALPSDSLKFDATGVSFAAFMSDLGAGGRQFWEQFAPANFEYDQFTQHAEIKVTGTKIKHTVFTNATKSDAGENSWKLEFRDTSTTSSFYIHLVPANKFVSQSFEFPGIEKNFPVTVYAKNKNLVDMGVTQVRTSLTNHEGTYGAFTHPSLVVYVTGSNFGGGMEYCGATATDTRAINHELAHMWFARGVMPASGNAGWVDEALATWTDEGFERSSINQRDPVNMSNWSLYRRDTDDKAYGAGAKFISELDGFFSSTGGMRPLLKKFFADRKLTVIQTSDFIRSLETQTNRPLQQFFDRYVFGKDVSIGFEEGQGEIVKPAKQPRYIHRPFTKAERHELL